MSQATPQINALHSVQFLQLEASPHFRAFLPWALLLLSPFSVRPFAASGKGVGRPRRDSVSSGELTTLRLNGRRHSSSSGSAAFHPNTRAEQQQQAAGVGRLVVRGGGAGGARQRRAEERAPPRKRPSLSSSRAPALSHRCWR